MNITFSHLVSRFFTCYLTNERGLSENTVAAYSDCMRLLITYACERFEVDPDKLSLDILSRELIIDFLDHLEKDRDNSATSRNHRLAAIKTFFQFIAQAVPELMKLNEDIQAIRAKSTDHFPPASLTIEEVEALIDAPDTTTLIGARDRALLQTIYNTGARVQEIAGLTVDDVRFDSPAVITLTGKRQKQRTVPLWNETANLIRYYLNMREQAGIYAKHLFINNKSQPMTRFGIGRRVQKHARAAANKCPSLHDRSISPHVLRHTTALHLIEAGNDITVVKEWLGHEDLKTASQYVEISVERKRKALEEIPPPASDIELESAKWKKPAIMDYLSGLSRKARYVA